MLQRILIFFIFNFMFLKEVFVFQSWQFLVTEQKRRATSSPEITVVTTRGDCSVMFVKPTIPQVWRPEQTDVPTDHDPPLRSAPPSVLDRCAAAVKADRLVVLRDALRSLRTVTFDPLQSESIVRVKVKKQHSVKRLWRSCGCYCCLAAGEKKDKVWKKNNHVWKRGGV